MIIDFSNSKGGGTDEKKVQELIDASLNPVKADVASNTEGVATNKTNIETNTSSIADLNTKLSEYPAAEEFLNKEYTVSVALNNHNESIGTLETDIADMRTDVSGAIENISNLDSKVSANTANIETNTNALNEKVSSTVVASIVKITQEDYDALVDAGTVDATILYLITE